MHYIRDRLCDDNVVENEEKNPIDEELSAKNCPKTKSKTEKHVLDMYLSSDNEHFDIFEGRCASLKNLSLELNTPLPASAAMGV